MGISLGRRGGERLLFLCAFLAFPSGASAADGGVAASTGTVLFDVKDYPRSSIREALSKDPCRPRSKTEVKDSLFSAELAYQGAVRPLSESRAALFKAWTRSVGDPGSWVYYKRELSFSEKGKMRWVAVPEGLLPQFQINLQLGERVLLYLIYVGCAGRQPVLAVEEIEGLDQTDEEAEDLMIRGASRASEPPA
ncbi:MAG: hypothetical protein WC728_00135 [Elusimicrobiota bacterium]